MERYKEMTTQFTKRFLTMRSGVDSGFYTIHSIIQSRKLKWIKSIIQNPEDNVQLRATLTGELDIDPEGGATLITPWRKLRKSLH